MKFLLCIISFMCVGCATFKPATKEELLSFLETSQQGRDGKKTQQKKEIEVVSFLPPEVERKGADQEEDQKTPAELVYENHQQYKIKARKELFSGGTVVYPFVPNHVYQIFTAPLNLTAITLEPGEELVSVPASGDTVNFSFNSMVAMEGSKPQQQVLIKPHKSGLKTTLFLNTNKRKYMFEVLSLKNTYMINVVFEYPLSDMKIGATKGGTHDKVFSIDLNKSDFNYEILSSSIHKPVWAPSRVFTNGELTFIQFFSAYNAAYAPVLFSVDRKGKREILNYTVRGEFYIVDRVLNHAELLLDKNGGDIVTIKRTK